MFHGEDESAVFSRREASAGDDSLSILDLENVVFTGHITERQRDRVTHETKYVIQGETLAGHAAEVVAKVGHTGRLFVITVYVV